MTTKKNKKNNASRKLIPAVGMLMVSALMLSTSTYAWFTMSREVEVEGINVTATVPENLQISPGAITNSHLTATYSETGHMLATIVSPSAEAESKDWSNSIVFSDYYTFGRLTPATSTTGLNMWYTKDATGIGKTLAGQTLTSSGTHDTVNGASDAITATFADAAAAGKKYMASALANDGSSTLTDSYVKGGAYYIDIPVWFRSSHDGAVTLAVKATVSNVTNARDGYTVDTEGSRGDDANDDDLINAVRVSILSGETYDEGEAQAVDGTANSTQKVLTGTTDHEYYAETAGQRPVTGVKTVSGYTAADGGTPASISWGDVVLASQIDATDEAAGYATDKDALITVPTGSANTYGTPVRYTIRVWIDGEDVDCYNSTAGQNFTVALKFMQIGDTFTSVRG